MTLAPTQVQQFRSRGFVQVQHFFSAGEVRAMQREVERFRRAGLLRNVATAGDGQTRSQTSANLQLCPMCPHSELFRALPFDDKVVAAVSALIGDPVILHLDQVFLKPGRHGSGTSWHQDNAYFQIADPLRGTAMWIAVHDATVANGTMQIIPDVFDRKFEHSRDPGSDHHIRMYPPEELEMKAIPMEMAAGGVVFFAYGTPHCTRGNQTDGDRAGAAFHFLHESVAATSHQADRLLAEDRTYHPYLTGPKATGGQREYGVKVAGTWRELARRIGEGDQTAKPQAASSR